MTSSEHLRGLALTTLFPGFNGTAVPPGWVVRLAAEGLGGVVLFGRNVDPARGDTGVAELTAELRAAGEDLLVAIDEEGGDVTRLDASRGSSLPGNAALGALDEPELTEQVASELGIRLRSCGIDLNFAPVADVDTHEHNPVIGVRSFGSDPDLVARHVAAFVTGQQSQGVAAAAKHFPGHGGTSEDSHLTVPVLDEPLETLRRLELPPFRAAIKSDVKIVMTGHILVPAIDRHAPATLSRAVITGLLREGLSYDGVVMTDGLDMYAISRTVGHAEAAVRAIAAGVDALCVGGDSTGPERVELMAEALVSAVVSGRLPEARLAEAAARVRALLHWSRTFAPAREARTVLNDPAGWARGSRFPSGKAAEGPRIGHTWAFRQHRQREAGPRDRRQRVVQRRPWTAAARAAKQAVRSHGDVRLSAAPLVLELWDTPSIAAGDVPWGVGAPLAARLPDTVVVRLTENGSSLARVLADHLGRRVVICVRGARRRPWQSRTMAAARVARPDLIVVEHDVGSAADVLGEHYVLAYGASRITAEAAAKLLAGSA